MLLIKIPGVTSFDFLKTVQDSLCSTFKDACRLRGYLADDGDWIQTMREACTSSMPKQIRHLFVSLLYNNPEIPNALTLWEMFREDMSEDYRFQRARSVGARLIPFEEGDFQNSLHDINDQFGELSDYTKNNESYDLPMPTMERLHVLPENAAVASELAYDVDEQKHIVETSLSLMNEDQRAAFGRILQKCETNIRLQEQAEGSEENKIFFVDAPGGTGKTFLFNAVLAAVRSKRKIAIATAFSGIAALLLKGGRTFHSRCGIPITLTETSMCTFRRTNQLGKLLMKSTIIIVDEAPMCDRLAFEAFERSLRDLMRNDKPFGGKIIVLGGDFRQTLPIIPRANRSLIVSRILKRSPFWNSVEHLSLKINMRVMASCRNQAEGDDFCSFLLHVGEGTLPVDDDLPTNTVKIPDEYLLQDEDLVDYVYPDMHLGISMDTASRAILAPKNSDVDYLNNQAMEKFPAIAMRLTSADSIFEDDDDDATAKYPIEYLNSVNVPGIPPHELILKVGVPVVLLRNLDPVHGLCNGTRLKIVSMTTHLLTVEILNGSHSGNTAFIPRIDLIPTDTRLPFKLKRRQFPIRLAFAMTINKSQGQSLKHVGIYLSSPVFTHGQLYVAYSRSGDPTRTKIKLKHLPRIQGFFPNKQGQYTRNVVYVEVLQ